MDQGTINIILFLVLYYMRILKFTIGFTLLTLTTLVAKSSFASIGEVTLHIKVTQL